MRQATRFLSVLCLLLTTSTTAQQIPLTNPASPITSSTNRTITPALFADLEALSRLVDISYCITPGNPGISEPFTCLSRCSSFPSFRLVTTWHTGLLITDSAGYIALDPEERRIVVAFRGTYSLANTVLDLATVRQEYVPYVPGSDGTGDDGREKGRCEGCAVHVGFFAAWIAAKEVIMPHLLSLRAVHSDWELVLVGHSLGGAVAALAGLEMEGLGWSPRVTTFGEPRVGNAEFVVWFDGAFGLEGVESDRVIPAQQEGRDDTRYRRVTHVDDPVPQLPLSEWGYAPHAGEIYINKTATPPDIEDLKFCYGNADPTCIAGQDESLAAALERPVEDEPGTGLRKAMQMMDHQIRAGLGFPSRYKLWQLLFAHRDYFWRLGLCVPELHPEL